MVFIRKIVLVLCCLSVLVAFAVPSFAVGSDEYEQVNNVLKFDSVIYESLAPDELGGVISFGFPWNSGYVGQDVTYIDGTGDYHDFFRSRHSISSGLEGIHNTNVNLILNDYFKLDDGMLQALTLSGGQQIIDLDDLYTNAFIIDTYGPDMYVENLYIRGNYSYMGTNSAGDEYKTYSQSFNLRVREKGNGFHVSDTLYSYFSGKFTDNIVFFNDITIYCEFRMLTASDPEFTLLMPCLSVDQVNSATYGQWLNQYRLTSVTDYEGTGALGFLADSVSAFFTFEIWPGFSISNVFTFVFAVAVLLWFIKLVR